MTQSIAQRESRICGLGIRYRLLADGAIVERTTLKQVAFIFEDAIIDEALSIWGGKLDRFLTDYMNQ